MLWDVKFDFTKSGGYAPYKSHARGRLPLPRAGISLGGCLWEWMFVVIYCFCCLFCRDLWYDVPLHVLLTCQKPDFPGKWWPTQVWGWLVAEQVVLLAQQSPAGVWRISTQKVTWASCWRGVAKAKLGWKENMESKKFVHWQLDWLIQIFSSSK